MGEDSFKVPGLIVFNHNFAVPLDHSGQVQGQLNCFVRELVSPTNVSRKGLPYLLYLQGGPGFESPRVAEASGWIKAACSNFRVILMDQRGTGRSSLISVNNLQKKGSPEQQAEYLTYFRADSIVQDAEIVRKAMVPSDNYGGRWTILGQSFGGFCVLTYLSLAPQGLIEAMITAGIPPNITDICPAQTVYRVLARRIMAVNKKYYARFPSDVNLVQRIVTYLAGHPGGGVLSPSGTTLITPKVIQSLGLTGLGSGGGFERLHYLLETFFDGDEMSPTFAKQMDSWQSWDTNPLYVLLHESIYCQGAPSNWAAQRVLSEDEFSSAFDAEAAAVEGRPVYFTGEMVFPWMFDTHKALQPYKEAANLLASKVDWGPLYLPEVLKKNKVPVAAATYVEDVYVDFNLAQNSASHVQGMRQFMTNEYKHSGLRDDGARIIEKLLAMVRDTHLVD